MHKQNITNSVEENGNSRSFRISIPPAGQQDLLALFSAVLLYEAITLNDKSEVVMQNDFSKNIGNIFRKLDIIQKFFIL